MARIDILGAIEKNAVTRVGEPSYTLGAHIWKGTAVILNKKINRHSRLNFLVHHQIKLEKQNLLGCGNRLNFKLDMSKFANGSRNILWLQIQDLLRPESCNMQIREGDNGVFVSGVKDVGSNYLLYYAPSPPNLQQHFFPNNCAI